MTRTARILVALVAIAAVLALAILTAVLFPGMGGDPALG